MLKNQKKIPNIAGIWDFFRKLNMKRSISHLLVLHQK